jgi:hypothetical protein
MNGSDSNARPGLHLPSSAGARLVVGAELPVAWSGAGRPLRTGTRPGPKENDAT